MLVERSIAMATRATIFKADLRIADVDRNYYRNHALTIACHPSETDERMMVRVLAFAMYASDTLAFGRGLSTRDEPDLWQKDMTGAIERWIAVGLPEERDIRRACGRSKHVVIIGYGRRGVDGWWSQNRGALEGLRNLSVWALPPVGTQALARLARRNMVLQCNIQEGAVSVVSDEAMAQLEPVVLLAGASR